MVASSSTTVLATNAKPIVYFAGKMNVAAVERHGSRLAIHLNLDSFPAADVAAATLHQEHGSLIVAGPIMIGCDHGCYHGPASHACGLNKGAGFGCVETYPTTPEDIMQRCFMQLASAEFVVLEVDADISCIGSLAEAGYAYARRKILFIDLTDVPESSRVELWFVIRMSLDSIERSSATMARAAFALKAVPRLQQWGSIEAYLVHLKHAEKSKSLV